MAQRANSQSEQTQEGKRLGHIPAKCVVLHVNHQKITNHYAVHGGNKNWFRSQENCQRGSETQTACGNLDGAYNNIPRTSSFCPRTGVFWDEHQRANSGYWSVGSVGGSLCLTQTNMFQLPNFKVIIWKAPALGFWLQMSTWCSRFQAAKEPVLF